MNHPVLRRLLAIVVVVLSLSPLRSAENQPASAALVLQTDFGLKDGAVSAMKGVAFSVSQELQQFDLTHEIPPFNIWEAAYRLKQTVPFWPAGTVFVSVVDPGVGTERRAIVAKTRSGHFIVTPDNGTLTFLAEVPGIDEVREIDATRHRRAGSEESHTFHGRDLFALTGARLASGQIQFADVGARLPTDIVMLDHQRPELRDETLFGTLVVLDGPYGNVWTNIPQTLFAALRPQYGDEFDVRIMHLSEPRYSARVPYAASFGAVPEGMPLLYLNSLLELALALNLGNFAQAHNVATGPDWRIEVRRSSVVDAPGSQR